MSRQPILNAPASVLGALVVLALVEGARDWVLSGGQDVRLVAALAFTPARFASLFAPGAAYDAAAAALSGAPDARRLAALFLLGQGWSPWWTPLTYALLHAGWVHLCVNGVWLLAFGAPVARRIGGARFWALLAVASVAGALMHFALHPLDLTPVVGASAAVSGVMAAAARFVFQGVADDAPAPPLRAALFDRRVVSFVVAWFIANLIFGLATPSGLAQGPVAWEAHIGGFLAGLLLFGLFDRRRAPPPPIAPDAASGPPPIR